jgi:TrmH family RNA methyltransferase
MITSTQNDKIKLIRQLQADGKTRRQEEAFVVEGVRLLEEALASGWPARLLLHSGDLGIRGQAVLDGFANRGILIEQAAPHVLQAASDTQTPQGLLAVLELRSLPLPDKLDFVLIADGIHDPGNLGSMLRSAAAAGAQAVLLPAGGVDPYTPKVVRSAMGAHFHLPIAVQSWDDLSALLRRQALNVFLADAHGELAYTQADLRRPLALLVGGEAQGAGAQAHRLASQRISIPMAFGSESLNAAAAAAVLLFEVAHQRLG